MTTGYNQITPQTNWNSIPLHHPNTDMSVSHIGQLQSRSIETNHMVRSNAWEAPNNNNNIEGNQKTTTDWQSK